MSKYNTAKIIKNSVYVLLLLFLIGYAIFNSRIFIAGPKLVIENPENGSTVEENPLIKVEGKAYNIAFIELNGKQINVNESSEFSEPVLLYPGYNIIEISARDKFEREVEKKIKIVYKNDDLLNQREILDIEKSLENGTSSIETSTSTPTTSLEEI